jgi:predicted phage-related endonuclease
MFPLAKEPNPENQRYFIGGSDAHIIMGSNVSELRQLWLEKHGKAEPKDLSSNLLLQRGRATENLNRLWYEAQSGQEVFDVQRHIRHPSLKWMGATLDGRVRSTEATTFLQTRAAYLTHKTQRLS